MGTGFRPGNGRVSGALGGEFRGDLVAGPAQGGMVTLHHMPQRGAKIAQKVP